VRANREALGGELRDVIASHRRERIALRQPRSRGGLGQFTQRAATCTRVADEPVSPRFRAMASNQNSC
jgi:hypothetical protein